MRRREIQLAGILSRASVPLFLHLCVLASATPCGPWLGALVSPSKTVDSSTSAFARLQEEFARANLTPQQLIRQATAEKGLGRGLNATVFPIAEMPDYVLRIASADVAFAKSGKVRSELKPVNDWAPGENFGQAIALVGAAEICKFQSGNVMNPLRSAPHAGPAGEAALREARLRLREAARLPQSAYDELARQYVALQMAGGIWDEHAGNLLIDFQRSKFGIVDVAPPDASWNVMGQLITAISHLPEPEQSQARSQFEREVISHADVASLIPVLINESAESLGNGADIVADRREVMAKLARAAHNRGIRFEGTSHDSAIEYSRKLAGITLDLKTFQKQVLGEK